MIKIKTKLKGGFLEEPHRFDAVNKFGNIKEEKLQARRERYRNGEYTFEDLNNYLQGELKEFKESWLEGDDPKATIRELADISNCIDMMAFCLIEDGVE